MIRGLFFKKGNIRRCRLLSWSIDPAKSKQVGSMVNVLSYQMKRRAANVDT